MEHPVGEDHHHKAEDPARDGHRQLRPAVLCRDGDEPPHGPPEPDCQDHVEKHHDADDVPVAGFDGALRAAVHASHAAFAAVRPEGAVVNDEDGFHRAVLYAQIAPVAGVGGIERLGKHEPPHEEITYAYGGDQQVLNDVAEGGVDLFPRQDAVGEGQGDGFAVAVDRFDHLLLQPGVEGDPVGGEVDGAQANDAVPFAQHDQRRQPEGDAAQPREEPF